MSYRIVGRYWQPKTAWGLVLPIFPAFFTFLLFSLLQISQLIAQPVLLENREKVLTIRVLGPAGEPENFREITFSINDLEKFPVISVRTETQWTNGVIHFQGPLMRDILASVGAVGDTILVTGLDGRSASIPREDIEKYDVIIACQVDGAYFGLRERGPLWIIYPWSTNPEIQSAVYYDRGIYHLNSLSVANQ